MLNNQYISFFLVVILSLIISLQYDHFLLNFIFIFLLISCIYFSKLFYYFISFPIILILFLSKNTLLNYDGFNDGIIISIFETNTIESIEFIKTLGFKKSALFCFILLYSAVLPKFIIFNKKIIFIFLFFISVSIVYTNYLYKNEKIYSTDNFLKTLSDFELSINGLLDFLKNKNIYNYSYNIKNTSRTYTVYVLIIGESVSKDYMSLYGYPVKTTPFIDRVNKKYVENYVSAAGYTTLSIPRTIAIGNNDIISLAKKSGLKTYWLSNQNVSGFHDSSNTKIALNSNFIYFLNKGKPDDDSHNDHELLKYFYNALNDNSNKDKLIVLHLRGSHYIFNERLSINAKRFSFQDKELSDYLATIYQTDHLIENVYSKLKRENINFSIVYFSDHGLNRKTLKHGQDTKDNFDIPFVEISSDFTKTHKLDISQSAYNFMSFFEDWICVESDRPRSGNFYDGVPPNTIKVYANGLNKYTDLPTQPIKNAE